MDGDTTKTHATTPLVAPHDKEKDTAKPQVVDTSAPVSTDEAGDTVDLPDLGGKID